MHTCRVCGGTGKEKRHLKPDGSAYRQIEVPCSWCHGTGYCDHIYVKAAEKRKLTMGVGRGRAAEKRVPEKPFTLWTNEGEKKQKALAKWAPERILWCCPATGGKFHDLAKIWRASILRNVPDAELFIWDYASVADAAGASAELRGDYAKALLSDLKVETERPLVITDADVLIFGRLDYVPSSAQIQLAMAASPIARTSPLEIAIGAMIEELGLAKECNQLIPTWYFWTRTGLGAEWMLWNTRVREVMLSGPRFEILAMAPGIAVWNAVWWSYKRDGRAELLCDRNRLFQFCEHVWIRPDRQVAAREMWKHHFGTEYKEDEWP